MLNEEARRYEAHELRSSLQSRVDRLWYLDVPDLPNDFAPALRFLGVLRVT